MSSIDTLLQRYVSVAQLPKLTQVGINQYTVSLESFSVHVGYFEEQGMIMLYAALSVLPETERDALYMRLLQANNKFSGSNRMTFGIDLETQTVTLQGACPLVALDEEGFCLFFDSFLAVAIEWLEQVDDEESVQPSHEELSLRDRA